MKRLLLSVLLSTTSCAADTTGPQAKVLVKNGAQLVDVRSPAEFAEGHLAGAVNVPIDELQARLAELPKDKDLVLYCRSGRRSAAGKAVLAKAGFTRVHDLGAMSNW